MYPNNLIPLALTPDMRLWRMRQRAIYAITGISDILRGSTTTVQSIKTKKPPKKC